MNYTCIPIHIHFTTNITQLTNFFMVISPQQHCSLSNWFEQLSLDQNMHADFAIYQVHPVLQIIKEDHIGYNKTYNIKVN